jgi:hypothetical protein
MSRERNAGITVSVKHKQPSAGIRYPYEPQLWGGPGAFGEGSSAKTYTLEKKDAIFSGRGVSCEPEGVRGYL